LKGWRREQRAISDFRLEISEGDGMSPRQIAWIKLGALVTMTGSATTVTANAGGCKLWVAILLGVGQAGASVYHALSDSPNEAAAAGTAVTTQSEKK
jgi:hypothetical protein